jgi:CheY-like chemotaxis protein
MMLGSITSVLNSVGDVLWPLIAAAVLIFLLPAVRKVMESREFSIDVLGVKLSAQAASDQLARQIEDLQTRVIELEAAPAETRIGRQHQERLGFEEAVVNAEPATERISSGSQRRRILWVDDKPENNAYEMRALAERGWEVIVSRDTEGGRRRFRDSGPFDAVISDLGRDEHGRFDSDAGLKLLMDIRSVDQAVPFLIYTSAQTSMTRGRELTEAGATAVTASPVELQSILAASTAFAFEQRVDRLLRSSGFQTEPRHGPAGLDFVARKGDRALAVEVISNTSLANIHRRLREARERLRRAAEVEAFTDLIVVTPAPVELRSRDATEAPVRVMNFEQLKGFLDGLS